MPVIQSGGSTKVNPVIESLNTGIASMPVIRTYESRL